MTTHYKGIELDDRLRGLIHYMDSVEEYRELLQSLQGVWDNLTLLGQLSGTGTDMTTTRKAFQQLTGSLLNNLGIETLRKKVSEMQSKAQVAVDIMIRNLFERTADIGFLATDDDIRRYGRLAPDLKAQLETAGEAERSALAGELDALERCMVSRFEEYVRKYSVYFNIILLDRDGNVLIQLDSDNPVRKSQAELLRHSLETGKEYVETFGESDLLPQEKAGLIYSYRVTDGDDETPLGVLCLCFRFHNETEGIFANLRGGKDDWCTIMLLDKEGRVIASSEEWHIPVGATMERVLDRDYGIVRFAGREYLAATRPTKGYQGFMGLGWYGHVMVPLDHAFATDSSALLQMVNPEVLSAVMNNPSLFSETLRNIPVQADRIQRELNRSVWNGNVRQSSDRKALNPAFSKVLLWEISNTGLKTKDVFASSIGNLHETVVSSILQDSQFLASLAIDIMDRNLYERANDCRWWALTTAFREMLAGERFDEEDAELMTDILTHINNLYTVYANLVVFNRGGRVVAVSNPAYRGFVGKTLSDDWVKKALALEDSQSYTVSPFEPTPLYLDRHTYIYAAAIRASGKNAQVAGGIGIVFDSEPQFEAMLKDALPRNNDNEIAAGCFGVFADRSRKVVASTNPHIPPGSSLTLDDKFFQTKNGAGISNIVEYDGRYFAVGAKVSRGYREYKGPEDAYRNDIVALVFVPLGPVQREQKAVRRESQHRMQLQSARGGEYGETTEIATFHIGSRWFGIRSQEVVEAIDLRGITPIPGAMRHVRGYIMYSDRPILVVDIRELVKGEEESAADDAAQIVVLRLGGEQDYLGLLVDSLGEIPEVPNHCIEKLSTMFAGEGILGDSIVKPEGPGHGGEELLVILSPETIRQKLVAVRFRTPDGLAAAGLEKRPDGPG